MSQMFSLFLCVFVDYGGVRWQIKAVIIWLQLCIQTLHTWESWIWATFTQTNQDSRCSMIYGTIQTVHWTNSSQILSNKIQLIIWVIHLTWSCPVAFWTQTWRLLRHVCLIIIQFCLKLNAFLHHLLLLSIHICLELFLHELVCPLGDKTGPSQPKRKARDAITTIYRRPQHQQMAALTSAYVRELWDIHNSNVSLNKFKDSVIGHNFWREIAPTLDKDYYQSRKYSLKICAFGCTHKLNRFRQARQRSNGQNHTQWCKNTWFWRVTS